MDIVDLNEQANKTDATENDQAIGSALRDIRETRALSARQLAEQSGVSAAMISRIERMHGLDIISYFNHVNRLLNGLGVTNDGDTVGCYDNDNE